MEEIIELLNSIGIDKQLAEQKLTSLNIDNDTKQNIVLPLLSFINNENKSAKLSISNSMLLKLHASIIVIADEEILYMDGVLKVMIEENSIPRFNYQALINNIHDDDRARFLEYISYSDAELSELEPLRIKIVHYGITNWVEVKAEHTQYNEKNAIQVLMINISDKIQAGIKNEILDKMMYEAESKRHNAEKIIERNARITAIGLISSGLTHEINQPLNAIKMGADGLLMWESMNPNTLPERAMKIIKTIAKSSYRIDEIIKHLRAYWGTDAQSSNANVSINECVNSSIKLLALKLKSHDISIEIDLDNSIESIYAEPIELELMLNNIIIHSINNFDLEPDRHDKVIKIVTTNTEDTQIIKLSDNAINSKQIPSDLNFSTYSNYSESESEYSLELLIAELFASANNAAIRMYSNPSNGSDFIISIKKQK